MELEGKTAVVTAGANGIGKCIADRMTASGANVVIADVDGESAAALAETLTGAIGLRCDVRSEGDLRAVRDAATAHFGGVDLLFNHAGISVKGSPEEVAVEDWVAALDLNVIAMVKGLRTFIPAMLERGSGHVVFTTSSLALISGHPLSAKAAPYITSKAAVIGLAQTAAMSLRPRGIGVTLFAPDYTDTAFARGGSSNRGASMSGEEIAKQVPYPPQTPEQAADVLMSALARGDFLASATPRHAELLHLQAEALLDPAALTPRYAESAEA